jgi:hypothetical protein
MFCCHFQKLYFLLNGNIYRDLKVQLYQLEDAVSCESCSFNVAVLSIFIDWVALIIVGLLNISLLEHWPIMAMLIIPPGKPS